MFFAENYFQRYKTYPEKINIKPLVGTGLIIVIPCYLESNIFETIESIRKCKPPDCKIEIIVVVNSSVNDTYDIILFNRNTYKQIHEYSKGVNSNIFRVYAILIEGVEKKFAGVGNARKLGMDEAVRRFDFLSNPNGVIVSLDADSTVDENYLIEIYRHFNRNITSSLAVLQFKHDFNPLAYNHEIIKAAKKYELYLRYFRLSLVLIGFPYAFHTIGSCFAVRASAYIRAGGMSRRQAGEDFYFIHKLAETGKCNAINKILVFPSPRISERVPFGTGPAIRNILEERNYYVYNFKSFHTLNRFFDLFEELYKKLDESLSKVPDEIVNYCGMDLLKNTVKECLANTSDYSTFKKRMFSKYNAFFVIKFLNSLHDNSLYENVEIEQASSDLLSYLGIETKSLNLTTLLEQIIKIDLEM